MSIIENKMFIVILVQGVIFTGLFIYLLYLHLKTRRLKKHLEELDNNN
jgi:CcmD family protein